MIEGILAWIMLIFGIVDGNPLFFIASGAYAVAAQIWMITHKGDKK